jgi:hypothetical protein
MIPRALKFVSFSRIEDHFKQGWVTSFPNAPMHHHYYGAELAWLCACPIPGLKPVVHRVPETQTQETADGDDRRQQPA